MPIAADSKPDRRDRLNDVFWGVARALRLAIVFGALAILLRVLNGKEAFSGHGATLEGVIATYVVTAVLGGAAAGILRPRLRMRAVSTLLGGLIGIVLGFAFHIMGVGLSGWTIADAVFLVLCFLGGLASGWGIWYRMRPDRL